MCITYTYLQSIYLEFVFNYHITISRINYNISIAIHLSDTCLFVYYSLIHNSH